MYLNYRNVKQGWQLSSQPEKPKQLIRTIIIFLVSLSISIIAGTVASTGNYKVIIFLASLLVISVLLYSPYILFLLCSATVLVISGTVLYFIPGMSNVIWLGYLLALSLYLPIAFKIFNNQPSNQINKDIFKIFNFSDSFCVWLVIFFTVSIISTVVALSPLTQILSALKSIFFMGSLWLIFEYLNFTKNQVFRWFKFLLAIAIFQLVICIYQFVFVRGDRISNNIGAIEAADSVVGTFGGSMESGGLTAVLAVFLISVLVMLSSFRYYKQISKKYFLILSILISPVFLLIEVKAIFVFFPIVALSFMKNEIQARPLISLLYIIMGGISLLLLLFVYQTLHWSLSGASFEESVANVFSYSFSREAGYFAESQGRLTRLGTYIFWINEHGFHNLFETFFGHGLGASKTQGLLVGEVARQHAPLTIDRIGLVSLLWDIGIFGVIAFIGALVSAMRKAHNIIQRNDIDTYLKAIAKGLFSILPVFIFSLFYRNDIPYAAPMMFILMSILGLIQWTENEANKS